MTSSLVELAGALASLFTTLSFMPQIVKSYRARFVEGISLAVCMFSNLSFLMWAVYGVLIGSLLVITINIIFLLLVSPLLVMKKVWNKKVVTA